MTINVTDMLLGLHAELEPYKREWRRWKRRDQAVGAVLVLTGFGNLALVLASVKGWLAVPAFVTQWGGAAVAVVAFVSFSVSKRRRQAHDRMMDKHSEVMDREIRKYERGEWPAKVTTLEDK